MGKYHATAAAGASIAVGKCEANIFSTFANQIEWPFRYDLGRQDSLAQGVYPVFFFNQSFIIEVQHAHNPSIRVVCAHVNVLQKLQPVDRLMPYHNGIVIIIVVFVLLCQLISTFPVVTAKEPI